MQLLNVFNQIDTFLSFQRKLEPRNFFENNHKCQIHAYVLQRGYFSKKNGKGFRKYVSSHYSVDTVLAAFFWIPAFAGMTNLCVQQISKSLSKIPINL